MGSFEEGLGEVPLPTCVYGSLSGGDIMSRLVIIIAQLLLV
jgi:hypothetical protein